MGQDIGHEKNNPWFWDKVSVSIMRFNATAEDTSFNLNRKTIFLELQAKRMGKDNFVELLGTVVLPQFNSKDTRMFI